LEKKNPRKFSHSPARRHEQNAVAVSHFPSPQPVDMRKMQMLYHEPPELVAANKEKIRRMQEEDRGKNPNNKKKIRRMQEEERGMEIQIIPGSGINL
jgi:hypothetical protein